MKCTGLVVSYSRASSFPSWSFVCSIPYTVVGHVAMSSARPIMQPDTLSSSHPGGYEREPSLNSTSFGHWLWIPLTTSFERVSSFTLAPVVEQCCPPSLLQSMDGKKEVLISIVNLTVPYICNILIFPFANCQLQIIRGHLCLGENSQFRKLLQNISLKY